MKRFCAKKAIPCHICIGSTSTDGTEEGEGLMVGLTVGVELIIGIVVVEFEEPALVFSTAVTMY